MRQSHLPRRIISSVKPSKLVAGVIAGAIALGGAGLAFGAVPGTDGVINACYGKVGGYLRIIDQATGASCNRQEKSLSWNQTGPQGVQGVPGPQGVQGPQGPQGDSAPVPVPPVTPAASTAPVALLKDVVGPGQTAVTAYKIAIDQHLGNVWMGRLEVSIQQDARIAHFREIGTSTSFGSLQLLRPDGTEITTVRLAGTRVVSYNSTRASDIILIEFTSATIDPFKGDVVATVPQTAGAMYLTAARTAPLSYLNFSVHALDPGDLESFVMNTTFDRDLGDFARTLLAGPAPTTLTVDQNSPDGTTVAANLVFGQPTFSAMVVEDQTSTVDGRPTISFSGSYTTLTTTAAGMTSCWSYTTGAKC